MTRKLCKELNEHFLCPANSDVIEVKATAELAHTYCAVAILDNTTTNDASEQANTVHRVLCANQGSVSPQPGPRGPREVAQPVHINRGFFDVSNIDRMCP